MTFEELSDLQQELETKKRKQGYLSSVDTYTLDILQTLENSYDDKYDIMNMISALETVAITARAMFVKSYPPTETKKSKNHQ